MNKEEILSKSRQENKDEGVEFIENEGRKVGYNVFCIVFIFIVVFNSFIGEQSYAVFALFSVFMAGESIPKYKLTHKKIDLIIMIVSAIAAIISLVSFVLASLR
ncbi:DUF6442 family protein [Clostridium septicum]|uniref:DUF6442 family protein n=1 Tax=Clostridium septicum TaxID=1504 RepID=A0A9N7PIR7_CLOSE|nr:DUF6442 family protein [Clostridium septicum]AYE33911.1 hypothetical protein CP523_05185 [Clostridium septicum]MDU1312938.1 DUF6442 family protein [Clostridium septicum]QAS62062.1 hypothetical protein EI377_15745 [Clostridium septicum]UEC21481.1 DUF6442 family protein [Clostridium septicum]USS00472.1 DUF6442 family protein [Clostridium septicum]